MKLNLVELEFPWPEDVALQDLRSWINSTLNEYGEPLRWAIAAIKLKEEDDTLRFITVEAVVILN